MTRQAVPTNPRPGGRLIPNTGVIIRSCNCVAAYEFEMKSLGGIGVEDGLVLGRIETVSRKPQRRVSCLLPDCCISSAISDGVSTDMLESVAPGVEVIECGLVDRRCHAMASLP